MCTLNHNPIIPLKSAHTTPHHFLPPSVCLILLFIRLRIILIEEIQLLHTYQLYILYSIMIHLYLLFFSIIYNNNLS